MAIKYGNINSNTISGTAATDYIYGYAGDDILGGLGGNDWLFGGDGFDTLNGGEGNDILYGGNDNDTLYGGNGDDQLYDDGTGDDMLYGEAGNDIFYAGLGSNTIDGGIGIDTVNYINSSFGASVHLHNNYSPSYGEVRDGNFSLVSHDFLIAIENVNGSNFDDWIHGDYLDSANIFRGNAGDDWLDGAGGNDILYGGDGSDLLESFSVVGGLDGNNQFYGEAGNDWLKSGTGNDLFDGGTGVDTADYSSSAVSGVTVNLSSFGAQYTGSSTGSDTLVSIENIIGSTYADNLTGNGADNLLMGQDGNDTLYGGAGNDILIGGTGAAVLFPFIPGGTSNGVDGDDNLWGGAGSDTLTGGLGNDVFHYSYTSDTGITFGTMDSILDFQSGNDKIDLSGIDADTVYNPYALIPIYLPPRPFPITYVNNPLNNQAFTSVINGGAFSGNFADTASLYYDTDNHILYGNNDGDAQADFAIQLTATVTALNNTDFWL